MFERMIGSMDETVTPSPNYSKRPLWQWIVLYVFVGLIIYALLYYFVFGKKASYNTQSNTQYVTPTAVPTVAQISPTASATAQIVTVTGNEFAFTPSTITVKKGEPVQITFKNAGKYPHNLTISELSLQTKTIQPGQEDTITFTPTKVGSFTFICTVPGHADRGMKGTLSVE